ncbi:hypothetical protein IWZ03DRAFT_74776 [Phyllosticta citriasiana]|uniref:Uncharacterized protein n=1 Tax=Phyllosticta citriasiana TaxID=595635 RepID=A0ABR1KEN2_9PEZI
MWGGVARSCRLQIAYGVGCRRLRRAKRGRGGRSCGSVFLTLVLGWWSVCCPSFTSFANHQSAPGLAQARLSRRSQLKSTPLQHPQPGSPASSSSSSSSSSKVFVCLLQLDRDAQTANGRFQLSAPLCMQLASHMHLIPLAAPPPPPPPPPPPLLLHFDILRLRLLLQQQQAGRRTKKTQTIK